MRQLNPGEPGYAEMTYRRQLISECLEFRKTARMMPGAKTCEQEADEKIAKEQGVKVVTGFKPNTLLILAGLVVVVVILGSKDPF